MAFRTIFNVVKNAVVKECTLVNDTNYDVEIIDYDGTRTLRPGKSQGNYLVTGFSLDLIMKLPKEEVKIKFDSSQFQRRDIKMSLLFAKHIRDLESSLPIAITAVKSFPVWKLAFSHPGGYEQKVIIEMVTKNSWKKMQEEEVGFEAKVGAMIKALEMSASFKYCTKLTRVNEYESQITKMREDTFKEACYIWQENIVIETDQAAPFDELIIPTPNTVMTSTPNKPGIENFVF